MAGTVASVSRSIPRRAAVLAGLGRPVQHAVLPIDPDALIAAELAAAGSHDDLMPLGLQGRAHGFGNAGFYGHGAAVLIGRDAGRCGAAGVADTRGVAGLLHVHTEVDDVH